MKSKRISGKYCREGKVPKGLYAKIKESLRIRPHGKDPKFFNKIGIVIIFLSLLASGTMIAGITETVTDSSSDDIVPLQHIWDIDSVHTNGQGHVCVYTSIALDSIENPHIAFGDTSDPANPYNLMYASKIGAVWTVEYADANGKVGLYASLDIDDNDRPHISHQGAIDVVNTQLKYTTKVGGIWDTETVDSAGSVGWFTSIAVDSKGNPHISYYDATRDFNPPGPTWVKYATNNGSGWNTENAFSHGWPPHPSIVFDPAENPHISSRGVHAEKNGGVWNTEGIGSPAWEPQPIAIASDGTIHIAYKGPDKAPLYYAVKKPGGSWEEEVVDPKEATGMSPSIALDSKSNPHISYRDTFGPLMHAVKVGGIWVREAVDPAIKAAAWTSIVLDSEDSIHISYYDDFYGILKYVKGIPLPDLVLSSIKFNPPNPWLNGTHVSINATIKNIGVVDAYDVLVNFSDNLNLISEEQIPLIVAPNGVRWAEASWNATPLGLHDICIHVDPNNAIAEYNESNNKICYTLAVIEAPDLTLLSIDILFNTSSLVRNRTEVTIKATIHNLGTEDAFDVIARFYDGDPGDPLGTGPGVQIDGDQFIFWIPSGENRTKKVLWTATPAGIHNIYVIVDPDNTIMEMNETNNIANKTIEVSNPDYVLRNSKPPPMQKIGIGKAVQISSQVKNIGKINATVESIIAFYDQINPLSPFKTYTVPPMNASEVSIEYYSTWAAPTTSGIYYVVIEVDYANSIEELNENNNKQIIEFDVRDKPVTAIHVGTPQYFTISNLYVKSSTEFSFTVEDYSETGYKTYYYIDNLPWNLYSGAFIIPAEGEHTIYFNSTDNLGNMEETKSYTVRVDNAPPATSFSISEPKYKGDGDLYWSVTSSTAFALSAVDSGLMPVGLQRTEYRIDDFLTWTTYTEQFNLGDLDDGLHTIHFRSVDNLGNTETEKSLIVYVDNTPPTTTISPNEMYVDFGTAFTLTVTDGDGCGVDYSQYSIDYGNWKDYLDPFTMNTYGPHEITYWSMDNLGNMESKKILLVIVPQPEVAEEEYNYKPLIALIFTIVLLVIGSIISYKRPLKPKGKNKKIRLLTWLLVVLPFIIAETITGVVSLFTGLPSVPPLLGAGIVVDLSILITGLIAFVIVYRKSR